MARNLPKLTLKATGKLNKHSLSRLKEIIELQRTLYNPSLDWIAHRPVSDFRILRDSLRKDLTSLRREDPDYRNILLNVSDGTIQRAIINHLRHAAPAEGTKPAGKPRRKSPERFRTLTILSPDSRVIFLTKNLGKTKLKIKGLPAKGGPTTREVAEKLSDYGREEFAGRKEDPEIWEDLVTGFLPVSWYDHEVHMKRVSKEHPDVLFTPKAEGENNGDQWTEFHMNGRVQREESPRWSPEPFDPKKLG